MIDYSEKDLRVFEDLKEHCLELFRDRHSVNVSEIAVSLMEMPGVPMHYPFHHFIVPASLLTATAAAKGDSEERLREMLETAMERAQCVVGGACGNLGACGAGVGAGIYMSVYTDSSPMSEGTWSWGNELTGRCLQAIAQIPGPRCCKRTAFLAIREAVPYANEKLGVSLEYDKGQKCAFYRKNPDCKREKCLFYAEQD